MLRCGVRTARIGVNIAVLVEPVVVSGYDFIENGKWILAGGCGVIVDNVHDNAKADQMQGFHHFTELADAGDPGWGG